MGTRMAPSYANLFLGKFEHDTLFSNLNQPYRFIDYISVIWTEGLEKLELFVDWLS